MADGHAIDADRAGARAAPARHETETVHCRQQCESGDREKDSLGKALVASRLVWLRGAGFRLVDSAWSMPNEVEGQEDRQRQQRKQSLPGDTPKERHEQ